MPSETTIEPLSSQLDAMLASARADHALVVHSSGERLASAGAPPCEPLLLAPLALALADGTAALLGRAFERASIRLRGGVLDVRRAGSEHLLITFAREPRAVRELALVRAACSLRAQLEVGGGSALRFTGLARAERA